MKRKPNLLRRPCCGAIAPFFFATGLNSIRLPHKGQCRRRS